MLPFDAWRARLKAELARLRGNRIRPVVEQMAGWMSPHVLDHEEVVAKIAARDPAFEWGDFLTGSKLAASYERQALGIPTASPPASWSTRRRCWPRPASPSTRNLRRIRKTRSRQHAADRYAFGLMGKQGSGLYTALASWLFSPRKAGRFQKPARSSSTTTRPSPPAVMAEPRDQAQVTPPKSHLGIRRIIPAAKKDSFVIGQNVSRPT